MNITPKMKIVNKISKMKEKNKKTIEKLKSVDLQKEFGEDYISPHSYNTIYDIERFINRMENCSGSLHLQTNDKQEFKILEKACCNVHSVCTICASAKRNKIQSEIRPYIETMQKMDFKFYMLTATIKNVENAGDGYEDLRNFWTTFTKKGQKREKGKSQGEAAKFEASIFSLETVKDNSEDSLFNVHAHVLIVSRYNLDYRVYDKALKEQLAQKYGYGNIPKEELSKIALDYIIEYDENGNEIKLPASKIQKEWYSATGGAGKNIDVQPIYEGKWVNGRQMSLEKQLYEIIKYETKPFEVDNPIDLIKIWDSVSGKHRTTKSGLFTMRKLEEWEDYLYDYDLYDEFWTMYYKESEFSDILTEENTESYVWNKPENEMFDGSLQLGKNVISPLYADKEEMSRKKRYQIKAVNIYRQKLKEHRFKYISGEFTAHEFVDGKEHLYKCFRGLTAVVQRQWNMDKMEASMITTLRDNLQLDCFKDVYDDIIKERLRLYDKPSNFLDPTYYPKELEYSPPPK